MHGHAIRRFGVLTDLLRFVSVWSGPPGGAQVVEAVLVGSAP